MKWFVAVSVALTISACTESSLDRVSSLPLQDQSELKEGDLRVAGYLQEYKTYGRTLAICGWRSQASDAFYKKHFSVRFNAVADALIRRYGEAAFYEAIAVEQVHPCPLPPDRFGSRMRIEAALSELERRVETK